MGGGYVCVYGALRVCGEVGEEKLYMMENYVYEEPKEKIGRKNEIRKNQQPIEELIKLVQTRAKEYEIKRLLKKDLSFLADAFAMPPDEYICLPEFCIGDNRADFVVLTGRSRMTVCIVEIKGANFYTVKRGHYHSMGFPISNAIGQIINHKKYIKENYASFRKYIHEIRESVINGRYKSEYLLGPKGELVVDPQKDIELRNVVIGGKAYIDLIDSMERNKWEEEYKNIEIYSWDSFIRRLDQFHGHYFLCEGKEPLGT